MSTQKQIEILREKVYEVYDTIEQKAQWEEEFRIKELERIRKEHEEMGIPLPEDFEQSMM